MIIKISSIQYFHRLLHLPCLLHVQQGRDPQVGNPLNVCVMLVKHCLSLFSLIQRTAADNLAEDSAAAWFLVFASAFWWLASPYLPINPLSYSVTSPWLVLCLLVMLMRRVGKLTAPASTFNSTLIWLWPNEEKEVLHSSQDRFFKDLLGALLPGRQVSVLLPCEVRCSLYTIHPIQGTRSI